ncbi:MAG TPA: serine/threonine-protein kinase [Thermomicrobiales bacterium]|nr:serine/threonine-protein kinase [Thermomicrobiales bacterium]
MTAGQDGPVLGAYRLLERIGKGGMGEVYRAQHLKLGREAAVKVLPANLAAEADFLKRFQREAASAASLEHPNILPVWDYGEQGGAPYLVMPFVRAGTLKDRLERGPVDRAEALNYLGQMAAALDYAHERGIIHRDVKPANMLLDGRGRLYLADFGIAKALEGAEGLTRTGVGVGTPEYMAPEQAQGRADARSDLYALGVILYQLLTGRVPYTGNSTVEVLMKHLQEPLPVLPLRGVNPALPPRIEGVIQKALAKNPNDRYQSGAALVEAASEALASAQPAVAAAGPTVVGAPDPARTVVAGTSPPGWQAPPTNTPAPPGWQTPPASMTPPPVGGTPPPGWPQPGPQTGQTAPAASWGQPAGATPPPPAWQGAAPRYTPPPPPAGGAATGSPLRKPWLIAVVVGVIALLLLCGGGGVFALTRPDTNATATAHARATETSRQVAAATGTSQAVAAATGTAGAVATMTASAPTATPVPPTATTVPPTATAAPPTPTAVPPTPTTAPVVATKPPATTAAKPAPNDTVPAGWKVYYGTTVPFVMAYPPDWTVDESDAAKGQISFESQEGIIVEISTTGKADPAANVDTLRDQYAKSLTTVCEQAAIDFTRYSEFSGVTFASLATKCAYKGKTYMYYIGAGLNNAVEWDFALLCDYDQFDTYAEKYYNPMLRTLNIYKNP